MGYLADLVAGLNTQIDSPLTRDGDKAAIMRELAMVQQAIGTGTVTVSTATVRTINRATLINNGNNLQAEFQAAYDAIVGINAPDTVPAAITSAANALSNTSYKIYLGHTQWWYTNTQTSTLASWTVFGGNKSNFAAAIPANHIFTFK
jgi:hypothetical protein